MIARRQVLATLLGAFGSAFASGCARTLAPPTQPVAPTSLDLDPLVDLVPAAGLVWLVELRPRELQASPPLAAVFAAAATSAQLDAFARRYGGVDVRQADQVAVSGHGRSTLGLARLPVDPWRVEQAFTARAREVEGRAVERAVTRFWGTVGEDREQVAVFGREGVGIEHGGLGPLQAAIYFAEGRLKRSLPALRAEPLSAASALLGEAPVRAFAPGPFGADWAGGFGGLLGAATAVAARLRATEPGHAAAPGGRAGDGRQALRLQLVLTGAWGADAPAAADRFAASFRVLGEDPFGRLTGLDRPLEGPVATAGPDALALDVALDPVTMSRGVRAASGAPLAEIMAF
ncbi:MAG TPA: hypothetical protein VK762_11700 [Polyangiaceae bacterium]|nr:hypothetical protein [Polyangiaceae bacterium]